VLAGVILQYVWRVQEMFPILAKFQFTALVSLGAVGLFIVDPGLPRRLGYLQTRIYLVILGILALAVLSVPTSLRVGGSLDFLTGNFIKTVLMTGILAASIRDRRDVDRMLRAFVLGGTGYVLSAIALAPAGSGRLGGGSYDPNDLGLFTVSTIPLCIYLMRRQARTGDRIMGLVATAVLLFATVLSGSRGGFLALVAVASYGLISLKAVRASKRIGVMITACVVMLLVADDAYWGRMRTILAPKEDYNWAGRAESGRIEVWKRGLGYMVARPLLGVGVYQFDVAEGTLSKQAAINRQRGRGFRWSAAHNSYVQIGAELGVFGLAAFVALLLLGFREARRLGRVAIDQGDRLLGQALGALMVGFAVGGVFLSQAYATYLYLVLGILIGFSRMVDREREAGMSSGRTGPVPTVVARGGRARR
jgi:O-antigen ligase